MRIPRSLLVPFALLGLPWLSGAAAAPWQPPAINALDLGPAFRGTHPSVLGMDGAYSLPLDRGRSLWLFGDTLIGRWQAGGQRDFSAMPTNTGAIAPDADWPLGFPHATFQAIRAGHPEALLPATPQAPTHRIWPLDLMQAAGKPWWFFVEIAPKGKGPLDFEIVGTGVAEGTSTSGRFGARHSLWPSQAPTFGTSVLVEREWVYLYAGGAATHLARMPVGSPVGTRFSYWAGDGRWADDWRQAAPLPGSGPEASVRYNPYLQAYVMVFVPPFGRTVEARFAPAPWGPWSEAVTVAPCQPAGDEEAMFYGAKQHVQLDSEQGRQIVITYNTNVAETRLADRPDLYWPRVLRVRFTKAGGTP